MSIASFRRLLPAVPAAAFSTAWILGAVACNGQVAVVLRGDASSEAPIEAGSGASCSTDQECNADAAISSLLGKCISGSCVCERGYRTPNGKCDAVTTSIDGGRFADCVPRGGVCQNGELPVPPNYRPASPGEGTCAVPEQVCLVPLAFPGPPICYSDQQCNGDPATSALWGTCFFGVCVCKPGFTVQPNGKCNIPPPPSCAVQKGTCRQMPATCLSGELGSADDTSMSCGDFIEATCCNAAAACKGPAREAAGSGYVPVDFTCCAPNDAVHQPICVNGWQTCPKGDTPIAMPGVCPGG